MLILMCQLAQVLIQTSVWLKPAPKLHLQVEMAAEFNQTVQTIMPDFIVCYNIQEIQRVELNETATQHQMSKNILQQ